MKLLFLPIDIDLKDIKFQPKEESEKNTLFNPWWNSTFISDNSIKENNLEKFLHQLPFKRITRIFYKTQRIPVGPHVDVMPQMKFDEEEFEHIKDNEPCGYRIVINGGLEKLHVKINGNWTVAKLPYTPICYLINSTTLYHKVDEDLTRETIYVRGWIDKEKHNALIDQSLKKFKEYAIYSS
jgi:hypothetical protein